MKLLTLARDLRRRKARERHGLFVAEGVRTVEELLASGLEVRGVLFAPSLRDDPRGMSLLARAELLGIDRVLVGEGEFASAAGTESPQGVLAIATVPSHTLDGRREGTGARVVVLDAVQDPGNVGTILRTAAALGAGPVVALPGTVDLWNPKVVRSAMGAHFRLPTLALTPDGLMEHLGDTGTRLWAADAQGEPLGLTAAPARLAIALGNEGAGLSPGLRERADRLVSIPIASSVESLNVAVAAGILLYTLRA